MLHAFETHCVRVGLPLANAGALEQSVNTYCPGFIVGVAGRGIAGTGIAGTGIPGTVGGAGGFKIGIAVEVGIAGESVTVVESGGMGIPGSIVGKEPKSEDVIVGMGMPGRGALPSGSKGS